MTGAPSDVDAKQLREVYVKSTHEPSKQARDPLEAWRGPARFRYGLQMAYPSRPRPRIMTPAFALRRAVFEQEQHIPRPLDRDAHDQRNADHVVAPTARAAASAPGASSGSIRARASSAGRRPPLRTGTRASGRRCSISRAHGAVWESQSSRCNAQLPAESFYEHRGFVGRAPSSRTRAFRTS